VQLLVVEPPFDFCNRLVRVVFVGKIDLDVVLGPRFPRAVFRERMTRARNDAPAGGRKPFDRRVADAAACSGQKQRAAWLVRLRGRHIIPGIVLA